MDFKKAQFSAGEVAKALDMSDSAFQNIVRRSDGICDEKPIAGRRLFSAESALKYACVQKLTAIGVSPKDASWPIDHITFQRDLSVEPDFRGDVHGWVKYPTGKEVHLIFAARKGADSVLDLNPEFFPDGIGPDNLAEFQKILYERGLAVPLGTGAIASELNAKLKEILRARSVD
jgi:hypothetical protein